MLAHAATRQHTQHSPPWVWPARTHTHTHTHTRPCQARAAATYSAQVARVGLLRVEGPGHALGVGHARRAARTGRQPVQRGYDRHRFAQARRIEQLRARGRRRGGGTGSGAQGHGHGHGHGHAHLSGEHGGACWGTVAMSTLPESSKLLVYTRLCGLTHGSGVGEDRGTCRRFVRLH